MLGRTEVHLLHHLFLRNRKRLSIQVSTDFCCEVSATPLTIFSDGDEVHRSAERLVVRIDVRHLGVHHSVDTVIGVVCCVPPFKPLWG